MERDANEYDTLIPATDAAGDNGAHATDGIKSDEPAFADLHETESSIIGYTESDASKHDATETPPATNAPTKERQPYTPEEGKSEDTSFADLHETESVKLGKVGIFGVPSASESGLGQSKDTTNATDESGFVVPLEKRIYDDQSIDTPDTDPAKQSEVATEKETDREVHMEHFGSTVLADPALSEETPKMVLGLSKSGDRVNSKSDNEIPSPLSHFMVREDDPNESLQTKALNEPAEAKSIPEAAQESLFHLIDKLSEHQNLPDSSFVSADRPVKSARKIQFSDQLENILPVPVYESALTPSFGTRHESKHTGHALKSPSPSLTRDGPAVAPDYAGLDWALAKDKNGIFNTAKDLGRPYSESVNEKQYEQAYNNPQVLVRRSRPSSSAVNGHVFRVGSGKSKVNKLASTVNSQITEHYQLLSQDSDAKEHKIPEFPYYNEEAEKNMEEKLPFSTFKPGAIKTTGCRSHLDQCKIEQIALRRLRFVIESNQAEAQHLSLLDLIENG